MIDTGRRNSTDVPRNFRLPTVSKNSTKGSLSVCPDPKSLVTIKNNQILTRFQDFEHPFFICAQVRTICNESKLCTSQTCRYKREHIGLRYI